MVRSFHGFLNVLFDIPLCALAYSYGRKFTRIWMSFEYYSPGWDKPIHNSKTIRVITVGAGASGLVSAHKLQRSFEDFELILYEKNEDVGGTWLENKYPGFVVVPSLSIEYD